MLKTSVRVFFSMCSCITSSNCNGPKTATKIVALFMAGFAELPLDLISILAHIRFFSRLERIALAENNDSPFNVANITNDRRCVSVCWGLTFSLCTQKCSEAIFHYHNIVGKLHDTVLTFRLSYGEHIVIPIHVYSTWTRVKCQHRLNRIHNTLYSI